jgi:hypothetical protein
MYVFPSTGMIHLMPPENILELILIPYSVTAPFSVNDIMKGLNASNGLVELGPRYIIQLIINIPE